MSRSGPPSVCLGARVQKRVLLELHVCQAVAARHKEEYHDQPTDPCCSAGTELIRVRRCGVAGLICMAAPFWHSISTSVDVQQHVHAQGAA